MSHGTKSGQRRKRHIKKQRVKRRMKRLKARLLAEGKISKGSAPVPKSAQPA